MAVAALVFIFVVIASPMAFAKEHTVGGSDGWSQSVDYSNWASGETFSVGDTLVFNYGGSHGVDVVSKDDYDKCNKGNALKSFTGGATTVTLSSPGDMYFVCPTLDHCSGGMKLAIKVQGSSSGTTPATPSASKPNAASHEVFVSKLVLLFTALFVFMS